MKPFSAYPQRVWGAALLLATDNVVSVRQNDGSGFFSGTQSLGAGSYQRGVALGDVDGNGGLDSIRSS